MTGSAPRGPRLEIPKSRVKLAVELLPFVILLPLLSLYVLSMDAGWRQAPATLFLLGVTWLVVNGAGEIVRPPVLLLTSGGFRVSPRDKTEIPWADVTGFSLGGRNLRYMQWFRSVLFDYRPDRIPVPKGWLEVAVAKRFGSPTGGWIVGHSWDRSPEDVVRTLETWRKRHG